MDFELPTLAKPSTVSLIEPHEEGEARALIDAQFIEMTGKPMDMRPAAFYVVLKIYTPPEKIGSIYLTETMRNEGKYTSAVGLVIAMGPDAYKGERFQNSGPWCKVGDWVMFPSYESIRSSYRGVPIAVLADDRIIAVIGDPSEIESINSASKF